MIRQIDGMKTLTPLSTYVLVIVVLCFQGCVFQIAFALLAVMFAKRESHAPDKGRVITCQSNS